jgi:hypothetical protein
LNRELSNANSGWKLAQVQGQIKEMRRIMERNVEMILDRQEQPGSIEAKCRDLGRAAGAFRKNTRALRRFHHTNQVIWGVAVGAMVFAVVAVPIILLDAA